MATLIAAYRGNEMIGRCDARCYDARSTLCKCVCYGANHGAGYARALAQTQRHGQRWLERYLEERNLSRDQVTVTGRGLTQLEMPLEDSGLPSLRIGEADAPDGAVFWTVHLDPIDRPGTAVARRWRIESGQVKPDRAVLEAPDPEALADLKPAGFQRTTRADADPPSVHEVWVEIPA